MISINEIKDLYKIEDIDELRFDVEMMKLSLPAGTQEDFLIFSNYFKVLKEYSEI